MTISSATLKSSRSEPLITEPGANQWKKNYSSATGDALSGADQTQELHEQEESAGFCSMGAVGYFLICKASTA